VALIEEILDIHLGPETDYHYLHRNFSSNVFRRFRMHEDFSEDLLKAAERRRSLG